MSPLGVSAVANVIAPYSNQIPQIHLNMMLVIVLSLCVRSSQFGEVAALLGTWRQGKVSGHLDRFMKKEEKDEKDRHGCNGGRAVGHEDESFKR